MFSPNRSTVIRGAPRLLAGAPRCSQTCCQRSQTCCQCFLTCRRRSHVLPSAHKALSGIPRCSQTYHNHSQGTLLPVIRDLNSSEGQPECPPMAWYSPEIDASQFTFHIFSHTPGHSQRLSYILLMKKDFSIHLFESKAWWETIGIQMLLKTIEECVIHYRYPQVRLVSHISASIWQMGSGDNFTVHIFEWLHIVYVKAGYWSSNKVNYIGQMLMHNDQYTDFDYMEETLSYLALQGWYNIDSEKVCNLLSTTDEKRGTWKAYLLRLQTVQDQPIIHPASEQVYCLRQTHIRTVCISMKSTSLRDSSEDFGIHTFE